MGVARHVSLVQHWHLVEHMCVWREGREERDLIFGQGSLRSIFISRLKKTIYAKLHLMLIHELKERERAKER